MSRVSLEPSYVLHSRAFRESSRILEVFSQTHGVLAIVARGFGGVRSSRRALLQPFVPLLLSWSGRAEMKSLVTVEAANGSGRIASSAMACGFYLNELLLRLLPKDDPFDRLFQGYANTLSVLKTGVSEASLRIFEKRLLEDLGYALVLDREASTGQPLARDRQYCYIHQHGPVPIEEGPTLGPVLSGHSLLALAREQIPDEGVRIETKTLLRFTLAQYLGPKPLFSRTLFR